MELQEAWRDVIRPTMRREPKTPGNKGVEVVMVDLNGDGIPDPPEPEREPIKVTTAAAWADLNDYEIGSEVFADVAAYKGGNAATTTYRYRWQTKATAEDSWVNGKWTNYDDHAMEVSTTITDGGQIRFQCQARDTSVDPVEQVNSFTSVKNVPWPPLKCDAPPTISGEMYVGRDLTGTKAVYSGGIPPVTVESQIQRSDNGTSGWSGVDAWGSDNAGTHHIGPDEEGKYFRVAGRGIDQSENAVSQAETLMSFSEVVGPAVTPSMGQPRPYVDDEIYDPNSSDPIHLKEEQTIELRIELPNNDGGQPDWRWDVRSGSARLSPNGPYCAVFNQTAMGNPVAVQVDMMDNDCSDSPHSIRYSMFVTTASRDDSD